MRTLVLQLFNSKNRPSFSYRTNQVEISALVDSGAETPVWCKGEKRFLRAYPNAVKQDWMCNIRGFGQSAEKAGVYVIPVFELSDRNETYRICNLTVAVCRHPQIGYDFVLSDTMFAQTDTFIHRIGDKYIELFFEKEEYRCAIRRGSDSFSIVTFAQDPFN